MSGSAKKLLHAAAGTAAAGGATYVEDVFSTFLYDGVNSANTITNGIDLDEEGGLVWCKDRKYGNYHRLYDTERGVNKYLDSASTAAQGTNSASGSNHGIDQFNSNGFRIGGQDGSINDASSEYVSWSFRKQTGFFDVVTWTGNATGSRAISHGLDAKVGTIIVKCTSHTQNWAVYHSGIPTGYGNLSNSSTFATGSGNGVFGDSSYNNIDPTTSVFYVGTDNEVNGSGRTYVAYVFAEGTDTASQIFGDDEDKAIIKCGTFSTPNNYNDFYIDCGFEVQWAVFIRTNDGGGYLQYDNMRGFAHTYNSEFYLNSSSAEGAESAVRVVPTATGFANLGGKFEANSTYAYIAIRRGPMKEPDAGTEVFSSVELTANAPGFKPGFPVDWGFYHSVSSTGGGVVSSRFLPKKYLQTTTTAALTNLAEMMFNYQNGWYSYAANSANTLGYSWRRQPKVFDVVVYDGNATAPMDVKHNLGVAPELLIFKKTSATEDWNVLNSVGSGSYNNTGRLFLNKTDAYSNTGWGGTLGSATAITVNTSYFLNQSGSSYQVLLFASLAGVSAVNEYSGTGNDLNVTDLGASARFVMIKRIDTTGDWYVFDTIQTFTASEAKYWTANGGAQVASTSYVEPHSSGFTVTSSAPAGLNADGGTYLYLAFS